jgi:hypothetical protein
MAGLRPIGSEKLEGIDKIRRIMEIAKYNEVIPQSINESKSDTYSKKLADGNTYVITKEKNGYVIKRTLTESVEEANYIEPMRNRKYYSSYSQAFKRLNLIAKEVNVNEGNETEISLYEQKKFTLKTPKPAPAPVDEPSTMPTMDSEPELGVTDDMSLDMGDDTDMGMGDDMDMGDDTDMGDTDLPMDSETEDTDELVSFKTIQKLTGKLAQKIRSFTDKGEEMTSKDIKYVVNSILSALELNNLDEEDRDEILEKFEESDYDLEMGSETDIDLGDEELGTDTETSIEDGEMGEGFMYDDVDETNPDDIDFKFSFDALDDVDSDDFEMKATKKVGDMFETIFSESKVDKVLEKYFKPSKTEKTITENKNKKINRIKTISESISQEVASIKFLKKHPNAKLVGKTNKNNLVFVTEDKKYRVSPKGIIL